MRIGICRALLAVVGLTLSLAYAWALSLPGVAGAEVVAGPAPVAGPSGLPDGRLYEEVSPPDKNGNYVASGGVPVTAGGGYALAAAGGNEFVFLGSGAMGDASSSMLQPYVARRVPGAGWVTSSVVPAQQGVTNVFDGPDGLIGSADFSRFAFAAGTSYSPEEPFGPSGSVDLYLSEDPFAAPTWLGKPTITDPMPQVGENRELTDFLLTGGSPTLSTVYFTYTGTLIAQDASRAPNVGDGQGNTETNPWGFYEWTSGALSAAGVLPDGTLSPFGAVPAALAGDNQFLRLYGDGWQAADFDNQVSLDGSRAFFVSPDPLASTVTDPGPCAAEGPCTSAAPELYVREPAPGAGKQTVLISQSQLPGHVGEPAPDGPVSVTDGLGNEKRDKTYVYGSADGTRAFFASRDQLTVGAPADTEVKEYEFDLQTGSLTYLPGVVGPIVAAAQDGSDFMFENTTSEPGELELWRTGAGGGQVSEIAQLPTPVEIPAPISVEARASLAGSVFVFDTNAPVPGGFNNSGDYDEVYRYDTATNVLSCVSCPPAGVTPTGNATISYDDDAGTNDRPRSTVDTRVISADGSKVFFDTPEALVSQDTNGKRDVYEWEDDKLYLISPGVSNEDSFYLDNSESGGDVFINTVAGLAIGDTDGAYDAYDARIPRVGDNPPPAEVPCQGDVCQGPPSVPQLLGAPASATFDGLGNLTPTEPALVKPKAKAKAKAQMKAKAKAKRRAKGKRRSAVKRAQARRHTKRATRAAQHRQRAEQSNRGGGK